MLGRQRERERQDGKHPLSDPRSGGPQYIISPSTFESEYPTLQAAATLPLRGSRHGRPAIPSFANISLSEHVSPARVTEASSGPKLVPSIARDIAISTTDIQDDTGTQALTPALEEEANLPRPRAASEPLTCQQDSEKPFSISLGLIHYLLSPRKNALPYIESRREFRSEYANKQLGDSSKKSLNVDSPSFTPAQLPMGKKSTFSTNATPFTPRGAASCKKTQRPYIRVSGQVSHIIQPPILSCLRTQVPPSLNPANFRISRRKIMT